MPANVILQGSTLEQNPLPQTPPSPKVVLDGEFHGKPASFGLDDDMLSKHTLFVGGTGCGKSNLFYHFVKQLKKNMSGKDVMIIFDSKGDFHDRFPPSPDDVVIGNSPQYRDASAKWNIFREVLADGWDDAAVTINAQEICKAFFEELVAKSNNAFFPNAARDVLASIIIAVVRAGNSPDKSFANEFFNNAKLKELINRFSPAQIVAMTQADNPDMEKIKTYIGGGGQQAQGVLAEMYSVAGDILRGVFAEKGMFSVRDFVRKKDGKTLYIEYDLASGSVLAPIYTLLFDLALKEALGRASGNEGNVYLIVDELKLLPRLQHMDDGINFGRSLGVKILAGLQSIEQLYANYEEADAKNIIAGFSSIYAFRANDPRTREYARDLCGENVVMERWQGTDRMLRDGTPRNGHTVEDWDLRRLRTGEAVVGLPGNEPFRFQFELYRG
jgi:type IV secretory pathway TraG/TraD family ATPase VirD4